jgi:hypothetical protein
MLQACASQGAEAAEAAAAAAAAKAIRQLRRALKHLLRGMAAPLTAADMSARFAAERRQKQQNQQPQGQGGGLLMGVYDEKVPMKHQV